MRFPQGLRDIHRALTTCEHGYGRPAETMDHDDSAQAIVPARVFLCRDCEEVFAISDVIARSRVRILLCPCCGSTDLEIVPPLVRSDAA